ncbi:unnamed protein product [Trichobilharzia szidati]|nr:unnamed protein product [Trichobilharzia szidati]
MWLKNLMLSLLTINQCVTFVLCWSVHTVGGSYYYYDMEMFWVSEINYMCRSISSNSLVNQTCVIITVKIHRCLYLKLSKDGSMQPPYTPQLSRINCLIYFSEEHYS